jgi:hypothetical protein
MSTQNIYVDGIGVFDPGLNGWDATGEVLAGRQPYATAPTTLPSDEQKHLRQSIPVARSLPVLTLLAQGRRGSVVVDYLHSLHLGIEVGDIT